MIEKELDNNMALCEQLIMDFSVKMREVFNRQASDQTYLNRNDYESCYNRAVAAYIDACKSGKKILALSIAKENEVNHNIDTSDEQKTLIGVMTIEDIEKSEKGVWLG